MREPKEILINGKTLEKILENYKHWLNRDIDEWKNIIGEYPCVNPCVDYLHNALRFIKDNKLNQAYEEICFAILKSNGILTKEEQGNFENILKYVDK